MNKIIYQFLLILLLLENTKSDGGTDTSASTIRTTPYIIYHKRKTFPRPLLIENTNEVLAFSGTKSVEDSDVSSNAFLSKYNTKGELIEETEYTDLDFEYEVNVCIRQLNDNTYVAASGAGDLKLIIFNETKKIEISTFSGTNVISFKIDLFVTHDKQLIVGYCSQISQDNNVIKVQKYNLDYTTNKFNPVGDSTWSVGSDNRYISCVEMGESVDYKIICIYITYECQEKISLFDNNLNERKFELLEKTNHCPFDKIIKLDDTTAVATYQSNDTMRFSILNIHKNDDDIVTIIDKKIALEKCILNTNKVDVAVFNSNRFVFTCINYAYKKDEAGKDQEDPSKHNIRGSIVDYNRNAINVDDKISITKFYTSYFYTNFPFISKFGLNFLSIFYHIKHTDNDGESSYDDVFEIIGYPGCANRKFDVMYINSFISFNLENYVVSGTGEEGLNPRYGESIKINFPEAFIAGQIKVEGNAIIPNEELYDSPSVLFEYHIDNNYGDYNIKFQPVRGDFYGRYCWLIFKVKNCHIGCFSCSDYVTSDENHKCTSCDNAEKYYISKDFGGGNYNCENEDTYEGHYVVDNERFADCHENCKTCKFGGNDLNQNCTSCKSGYYFKIDELSTGNCYNGNQNGYFIKDDDNDVNGKIYDTCDYACLTCEGKPNSVTTNCLVCKNSESYYKTTIDESNCLKDPKRYTLNSDNAYEPCMEGCLTCSKGIGEVIDNEDLRYANYFCIECDQENDDKYYFLKDTNNCFKEEPIVYDNDNIKINFFLDKESSVDPENWNWVSCYKKCEKCSRTGTDSIMNCDSCKSEYYHEISPSTNCIDNCPTNLGYVEITDLNKWCVNCKNELNPNNLPKYKYIGNNDLYKSDLCLNGRPVGTYIDNSEYNTLKDCDVSCKLCKNSATYCTECAEGYIFHPLINNKCVKECTTKYWYLNDNNDYKCTDDCNEINDCIREYLGGKQCVKECDDTNCIFCEKNNAYLIYDIYCVFNCPKGYEVDSTGKECILKTLTENNCNIKLYPSRHSTLIPNLKLFAMEWIEEYIYNYDSSLTKNVDVLPAHNMTMQIWKDDICELESSLMYDISFVNTSECRKILQEIYTLPYNGIIFVKFDINRTITFNQIHYNAYNAFTKERLELSHCKGDLVDYALNENAGNFELSRKLYEKYGVDIFNSSEDFFNDNCFQFDDQGKDVTLEERRLFYFQNVHLCEEGCQYMGINYTQNTLRCQCQNSLPTLNDANEITEPELNNNQFYGKIDNNNFKLFKCTNLVFSGSKIKKNLGSLTLIILGGLQIPLVISFVFFSGFQPIYSFLNQFTYINRNNPPKKTNENFLNDENIIKNSIDNSNTSTERKNEINENSKENNYSDKITISNSPNPQRIPNEKRKFKKKIKSGNIKLYNINNTEEKFMSKTGVSKEEKDDDVEDFNEDEKDELNYIEAIKFDDRDFFSFLWRAMKKKILFLFTFTDVNVFEPITIKLTYFIFLISLFFFLDAIFFKKIYVQIRFYSTKKLDFKYFIKNEIKVSVYSALLGCFIGIIISYLISVKKQFDVSIRNIRKNNEFLKQIKSILKVYEIKMIIFLIINFICMFVFWYFCTAFCSMYIKTTEAWLYAFIFTLIFSTIFQFVYAVIISCLRFIGLSKDVSWCYTVSKFLL